MGRCGVHLTPEDSVFLPIAEGSLTNVLARSAGVSYAHTMNPWCCVSE
jgi:hypothetical protein